MAAILQTTFSMHFLERKVLYFDKISLNFVPMDQIDKMTTLVEVVAWRWMGGKPLPDPMLTSRHEARVSILLRNRAMIYVRILLQMLQILPGINA